MNFAECWTRLNVRPCSYAAEGEKTRPDDTDGSAMVGKTEAMSLLLGDIFVDLADLEPDDGLEKSSTIHAPGEVAVLQHLLGHLTVFLCSCRTELALDVTNIVKLAQIPHHLNHGDILVKVFLLAGTEAE